LPVSPDPKKNLAMYPFVFRLPQETVETGYGTFFPKRAMDLPYYSRISLASGFTVEHSERAGRTFRLVLLKPAAGGKQEQ
jgi:hypothetical protein